MLFFGFFMNDNLPINSSTSNLQPFPKDNVKPQANDKVTEVGVLSLAHAPEEKTNRPIGQAEVIILVGTSSVGKTSIIQEIKRQSQEREWKEFDSDLVGPKNFEAFWDQERKNLGISEDDYAIFKAVLIPRENNMHLHHAIGEPAYLDQNSVYKEGTTPEQKKIAINVANTLRDPTDRLFNQFSKDQFDVASREILLNAESGISTIIGVLDDSELFKGYPKPNARVTTVLVYCSFQSLSDRIAARNNTALESGRYEEFREHTHFLILPNYSGQKQNKMTPKPLLKN